MSMAGDDCFQMRRDVFMWRVQLHLHDVYVCICVSTTTPYLAEANRVRHAWQRISSISSRAFTRLAFLLCFYEGRSFWTILISLAYLSRMCWR